MNNPEPERRGTNALFHPPIPEYPTLADWERRRERLEMRIRAAAGIYPEPPKTPLNPTVTGETQIDGVRIQNLCLETAPGFYSTGNLYLPTRLEQPAPAVACPHGHAATGRFEDTEKFSVVARCVTLARHGNVVFSYDMVGVNDSMQIPHHYKSARAYLWSVSLLGLQLWNSVRALDYLSSLDEVDSGRLACVGASGGGTQTFLLTAIDRRVSVSAPVVMVSASMQGGCVCENAPHLRLDANNVEIAAMAAPRPLLIVSATGDWTRTSPDIEYPAIREIYKLYGAEERVHHVQVDAGHNFNRESRQAVYEWFGRWLHGEDDPDRWIETPYELPPVEQRRVFPTGLPDGTLTEEALIDRFIAESAARPVMNRRVLNTLYACALNVSLPSAPSAEQVDAQFHPAKNADAPLLLIEKGINGAQYDPAPFLEKGCSILFFNADVEPTPARPSHDLTFNLSDGALRVQKVLNACAYALTLSDRICLVGGLWSALALPYLDEIECASLHLEGVERTDRFFEENAFIPGIRKAGDLAAAAILRAPHALRLHGIKNAEPYASVLQAYANADVADQLTVSPEPASADDILSCFA